MPLNLLSFNLPGDIPLELVYCAAGQFLMGASETDVYPSYLVGLEKPQHLVNIEHGFWIMTTPVTRRQLNTIYHKDRLSHNEETLDSPASQHTWFECIEYCRLFTKLLAPQVAAMVGQDSAMMGFRLPTEAEWEYTCRSGSTTTWFFGDDVQELKDYAWYKLPMDKKLPPVKQKKPNPLGLYDVYGMVYEWCENDYYSYAGTPPVDIARLPPIDWSKPANQSRMARGGCCDLNAEECRSASRQKMSAVNEMSDLTGFRMVLSVQNDD